MGAYFYAITTLICLFTRYEAKDLPKHFPNCHRLDPNLNQCLIKATEQVKPYMATGVPELNIPPLDPFLIPQITLEQGTSALNFKANLTNVLIHGMTDYTFTRFDFDVPNLQFFCDATLKELHLEGDYTVTGKILLAPIVGSGKFNASVDSVNATVYQKVEEKMRKGATYILPVFTNTSIHVGGPKAKLEGLFDGNQELNQITNKVINDNVDELFEDLRPVLEKVLTNILEDLLFKGFESQIPFAKLYPPIP
ncbi:protein takeout [Leptinotarsa decemlineata]|uniref:protein takeout n=1 Tax=Leptinotarsa decemlineata TaxID=7539 RepID=UPI003D30A817